VTLPRLGFEACDRIQNGTGLMAVIRTEVVTPVLATAAFAAIALTQRHSMVLLITLLMYAVFLVASIWRSGEGR
jgi:hypothetical protein